MQFYSFLFLGGGWGGSGNANEIQKQSITYVEPEMILMQKLLGS